MKSQFVLGASIGLLLAGFVGPLAAEEAKQPAPPKIQLAILLDTSNSMDGLINQARTQLWSIVNEFQKAKLAGQDPQLLVALYEYGNDSLPASEGYIRLVVQMTDDLDKVSEALFALTTNGGNEFCGQVIDAAVRQLAWSDTNRDLRCIFIAGNEPFTQGDLPYEKACKAAADKGITISTIFCGNRDEGITTGWQQGAQLADGTYLCINQEASGVDPAAPQDNELARLSAELNSTYLAYGRPEERKSASVRQQVQDANAAQAASAVAASRADFKASKLYRNSGWDLVDAVADGTVKLEDLKQEELPEAMQSLSLEARREFVAKQTERRKNLQEQIRTLSEARRQFVAAEKAKIQAASPAAAPAVPALGEAIMDAVREAAPAAKLELNP